MCTSSLKDVIMKNDVLHDVLVVDDEQDIRELISDILKDHHYNPRLAKDSDSAFQSIDEGLPAAVILDIWLQGSALDGIGILEKIKQQYPHLPVIMISGHGNIETAISSIRLGAYDFIEKPFKEDRLLQLLERAIENASLKRENEELKKRGGALESQLIGKSPAMLELRNAIERVAPTSSRVLITGPAGCGKEVIARLIHQQSSRAKAPFITLNGASMSAEHIEEELFGIEKTTAGERHIGTLEKAHRGTLYIDEITDMPKETQAKLLRILQESSFERVGGNAPIEVDVRVIAATNKDIQTEISMGRFREDLYYRLNVVPIPVPALKERREDIVPLIEYFIQRCAGLLGVSSRHIDEDALAAMQLYDWPGNVRQLRNVIEWLLIMAKGDPETPIICAQLPPEITNYSAMPSRADHNADMINKSLREAREMFERQYLSAQLERFNGNVSKTAKFVGMDRSAFHRKLKGLGLMHEEGEGV